MNDQAVRMNNQVDRSLGTLGLVGAVLTFTAACISVFIVTILVAIVLGLAGLLMILVTFNKLSRAYNNPAMYRHALYGSILGIVGIVPVFLAAFLIFLFLPTIDYSSVHLQSLMEIVGIIAGAYVVNIFAYKFLSSAYRELARLSGIDDFNDAAKWYWYGGLLSIVIIGFVLMAIGCIYAMLGFSRLRS
jgi:uncharacterized membrane protein